MKTQEGLWSSSAANRPERYELHMYHAGGRNFNVRLCQNQQQTLPLMSCNLSSNSADFEILFYAY